MKRSTPLVRRASIKSSAVPLKRSAIAPESTQRASQRRTYSQQRLAFLSERQCCEVQGCIHSSEQVHHMRGREGSNYLDESTWMAICPGCHTYVHAHPEWAYKRGYLLSRHTGENS